MFKSIGRGIRSAVCVVAHDCKVVVSLAARTAAVLGVFFGALLLISVVIAIHNGQLLLGHTNNRSEDEAVTESHSTHGPIEVRLVDPADMPKSEDPEEMTPVSPEFYTKSRVEQDREIRARRPVRTVQPPKKSGEALMLEALLRLQHERALREGKTERPRAQTQLPDPD